MKRKGVTDSKKLLIGEKVEVRSEEEEFLGSWHHGEVSRCENQMRRVEYTILNDDGLAMWEDVKVSHIHDGIVYGDETYCRGRIRLVPPLHDLQKGDLIYGLCVDAYFKCAWWEGVIYDQKYSSNERRVFFPDSGDERIVGIDKLRITMDWDVVTGEWKNRGKWKLLEHLTFVETKWPLPTSVMQICYDTCSENSLDWTNPSSDLVHWLNSSKKILCCNYEVLMRQIVSGLCSKKSGSQTVEERSNDNAQDQHLFTSHVSEKLMQKEVGRRETDGNVEVEKEFFNEASKKRAKVDGRKKIKAHKKVSIKGEKGITCDLDEVEVEKEFCEEAVKMYVKASSKHKGGDDGLISKVKKHLSAVGWTFHYKIKSYNNNYKREMRYVSTTGKTSSTLKEACRWYLENSASSSDYNALPNTKQ